MASIAVCGFVYIFVYIIDYSNVFIRCETFKTTAQFVAKRHYKDFSGRSRIVELRILKGQQVIASGFAEQIIEFDKKNWNRIPDSFEIIVKLEEFSWTFLYQIHGI
jgi:hypothetical protein